MCEPARRANGRTVKSAARAQNRGPGRGVGGMRLGQSGNVTADGESEGAGWTTSERDAAGRSPRRAGSPAGSRRLTRPRPPVVMSAPTQMPQPTAAWRWTRRGGSHVPSRLNGYERGVGAESTSTDGPRTQSWWCGRDSRARGERRRTNRGRSSWAEGAKARVGMEAALWR
jgi:hypothetical protein